MNYTKNKDGYKNCNESIRKGGWEQYTDFAGSNVKNEMEEALDLKTAKDFIENRAKVDAPQNEYKATKIYPEGFYRIYHR